MPRVQTKKIPAGPPATGSPKVPLSVPTAKDHSLLSSVKECVHSVLQSKESTLLFVSAVTEAVTTAVMTQLEKSLEFSLQAFKDLKHDLLKRDEMIASLQSELQLKTDELEQYQRRNSVRIFNVPEVPNDARSTDDVVIDIFQQKLGVQVSKNEICRSHRIGKFTANRPRPIIVKFISYRKRAEVFGNKKKLKGSSITIREDLTAIRAELLSKTISVFGLKNVWTSDGRIIIKNNNGKKLSITSESELQMMENQEV